MKRAVGLLSVLLLGVAGALGAGNPALKGSAATQGPVGTDSQAPAASTPEFLHAADEVLAQMSEILDLPIKSPLKKSLRSKDEIRAYLVREEKEDRSDAERYADDKTLEAFGLIPKGFPLDSFLLDVLTDQVAGLYDPQAKEFYIADWIPVDEQREVMAHELTHALEDQSFHIDPWIKAARPNDDAETAREAVSEGSALAAMYDYTLRDEHAGVRDLPDMTLLIRSGAIQEMNKDPQLAGAPPYIRDSLMFPYISGIVFTQQFLKAHTGWADLKLVFENPPVSTQQIMNPDLYLKNVQPKPITLPEWKGLVPDEWKMLEENVMGEFGLEEVLKQFLGRDGTDFSSAGWAGDRYAVFEDSTDKETPLVFRIALDNTADADRFFGQYGEVLRAKYESRTELYRQTGFLQFQTPTGGVFLRCVAAECLTVEEATRETYDSIDKAIGWDVAPAPEPAGGPRSVAKSELTNKVPPRETVGSSFK
jgi:hypothetical protein